MVEFSSFENSALVTLLRNAETVLISSDNKLIASADRSEL